jgi:plastocyanin
MNALRTITLAGLVAGGLAWPAAATMSPAQIVIEDGSPYFVPVAATVVSGRPIQWDNPTATHHTVTHNGCLDGSAPCLFDSGAMPPGGAFILHGLPPGHYVYHCRIHPIMRGVLAVTNAASTASPL